MSPISDDDRLLAELGEAHRLAAAVPAGVIAAGRAAFAWRTVDAELAALTYDSVGAGLVGTRAELATLRALTYATRELTIELELTSEGLLGQLIPAQPGQVQLHGQDGSVRTADIDELGWFAIRPAPSGMCRLRLRTADTTVLTEWAML